MEGINKRLVQFNHRTKAHRSIEFSPLKPSSNRVTQNWRDSDQAFHITEEPLSPHKVLVDTGASSSVTGKREDFLDDYVELTSPGQLGNLGKMIEVVGYGTVAWTIKADDGKTRTLELRCLHVPSAHMRIASTQDILKSYPDETITARANEVVLSGSEYTPAVTVQIDPQSGVPEFTMVEEPNIESPQDPEPPAPGPAQVFSASEIFKKGDLNATRNLLESRNINLDDPSKELLGWHYKLVHVSMKRIQWMMRQGLLATTERAKRLHTRAAQLTILPLCVACQFAKQRRRPKPGKTHTVLRDQVDKLKTETLFPGQMVSVDHYTG